MDRGGGVGLHLRIEGLPAPPIRLVLFDCDREGSMEWLERHGISSPLENYCKRGKHVIGQLPDDCPDLRSDTKTLNPGSKYPTSESQPGIDIKVSGLVVTPFSPNKRLFLHGRDITEDPESIRRVFQSLDSLKSLLPRLDPRVLVPGMNKLLPDQEEEATSTSYSNKRENPRIKSHGALSTVKPSKTALTGPYTEYPYSYRKDLARRFLGHIAKPAISGRNPDEQAFKVCCTIRHRYHMSEQDTLDLTMKYYNPRCKDKDGMGGLFTRRQLIYFIRCSGKEGTYDPLWLYQNPSVRPEAVAQSLDRLRARDQRSNERKAIAQDIRRQRNTRELQAFLDDCYFFIDSEKPVVLFDALHASYVLWMNEFSDQPPLSPNAMARLLLDP